MQISLRKMGKCFDLLNFQREDGEGVLEEEHVVVAELVSNGPAAGHDPRGGRARVRLGR